MHTDEITAIGLASLAARGMIDPVCLRADEKRSLCGSVHASATDRRADGPQTVIDRSLLALAQQLKNQSTSAELAAMTERGIDNPQSLSWGEIRLVCASVLTRVTEHGAQVTSGLAERPAHRTVRRSQGRPAASINSRKRPSQLPEKRDGSLASVPAE